MQRFELAGNKFWEVAVEGASLTTKWGKIGADAADAQAKTQTFANPAAAHAALLKLVAEKKAKGYREIKAAKPPKPARQTQERVPEPVIAPPPIEQPRATGAIDPDELVVRELRNGGGRAGRMIIDGKRVIVTGGTCLVSSNGERFHRRRSPGESWCLYREGDAIYSLADDFSVTRDFGVSWKKLTIPDDPYYKFCIHRDASGTYWMGADDGALFTSDSLEGTWKRSKLQGTGKMLDFLEVDGRLMIFGYGSHAIDGKELKRLKGIDKEHIICRATAAPSGVLIAIGDSGVSYRSTDGGATWKFVKTGVRDDLEDLAWVAGVLFVVGGDGVILKTTDDGASWTKIDSNTDQHLWGIASWGDGAFIGGEYGAILRLSAPDDPYWANTTDDYAPPPPAIDPTFEPQRAAAAAERERIYAELTAQAIAEHDRISVKSGLSRPRDANPRLAKLVEDAADDDATPAQVYADWLQGEGDPRGELAAIQLQRASLGKSKDLKKAEKELLAQHADRFLGRLVPAQKLLKLKWRAGFIYSARVANTHDNDHSDKLTVDDTVSWLLDEPSARFLRKLTVGIVQFFENAYDGVAERIGQRYLPALRELFLGDFDSEDTELSWSEMGDIEPIYASLPNLRSLRLRSGSMTLGKIVLPRLESFTVETGGLDSDAAQAIAAARWPGLTSLSIQIGADEYGGDASIDDLRPILDGAGLPRLEHLGLKNCELTDHLIEALVTSRILPQLKSLDLGMGVMSDDGAKRMYAFQKAFMHLENIDLEDNYITSEGKRLLQSTNLQVKIGAQRDDEGDPDNRYASAAE